jgi:hypothetical protein
MDTWEQVLVKGLHNKLIQKDRDLVKSRSKYYWNLEVIKNEDLEATEKVDVLGGSGAWNNRILFFIVRKTELKISEERMKSTRREIASYRNPKKGKPQSILSLQEDRSGATVQF